MNKLACILGMVFSLITLTSFADESMQYDQKTLPNGDVQTTYSSSDGSKSVSILHKDGSMESTTTAADGSKSVVVQHKDGSVDTHVTQPGK